MKKVTKFDSRLKVYETSQWNAKRLKALLGRFSRRKILVIGDVGVDRYTTGIVERISPEAPVPILAVESESLKLGLAANVADNIHALGAQALLVGVVGRDRGADDLSQLLNAQGISSQYLVTDESRRTVLKERVVTDRQQLLRIDYENTHTLSKEVEAQLKKVISNLMSSIDGVIIEDYAKGCLTPTLTQFIIHQAKRFKKWVSVDPHVKSEVLNYKGASLFKPNAKESEQLSELKLTDIDSLEKIGEKLMKLTAAESVVITRGKEGMAVFQKADSRVYLIPTYVRDVYDVSGAGDTVISVLSLAIASGGSLIDAAILGNLAAGVEVGKRGTATVTQLEIIKAMDFFQRL